MSNWQSIENQYVANMLNAVNNKNYGDFEHWGNLLFIVRLVNHKYNSKLVRDNAVQNYAEQCTHWAKLTRQWKDEKKHELAYLARLAMEHSLERVVEEEMGVLEEV